MGDGAIKLSVQRTDLTKGLELRPVSFGRPVETCWSPSEYLRCGSGNGGCMGFVDRGGFELVEEDDDDEEGNKGSYRLSYGSKFEPGVTPDEMYGRSPSDCLRRGSAPC